MVAHFRLSVADLSGLCTRLSTTGRPVNLDVRLLFPSVKFACGCYRPLLIRELRFLGLICGGRVFLNRFSTRNVALISKSSSRSLLKRCELLLRFRLRHFACSSSWLFSLSLINLIGLLALSSMSCC